MVKSANKNLKKRKFVEKDTTFAGKQNQIETSDVLAGMQFV